MRVMLMFVLVAAPGAAQTGAAPGARAGVDPNEIVCRRQPNPGSRVGGKRICKSRGDWEQEAREAQRGLKDMQQRNAFSNSRG